MFDELAYLIGFFLGGGALYSGPFKSSRNGKTYFHNDVVFVCSDIEPVQIVQAQIEQAFGKRYNMQTRMLPSGLPHYVVTAHRREIFDFFAVNTAMRTEIPAYYFSAPRQAKIDLCQGLMDADGSCAEFVDKTDPRYEIKRRMLLFSNTKLPIIQGLASILQSLGVKVGKISVGQKKGYRDCYMIRPNPRSFHEAGMSFRASRKQAKFNRYIEHVLGSETAARTAPVKQSVDDAQAAIRRCHSDPDFRARIIAATRGEQ
jgi:hypothetical protein